MNIKIAIYEDNERLRKTLSNLIMSRPEYQLTGEFPNSLKIIENCKLHMPDLIIMDIDMPYMSGIEATKIIKPLFPTIEIIMYTVFDDGENIFEAIKGGATGYLLKNTELESIIFGINDVMNGGSVMSPSIARKVLSYYSAPKDMTKFKNLSEREIEIITEISNGLSYKMIAAKLFLSVETVRTHLKRVYKKLHVNSSSEAINMLFINK